MCVSEVIVVRCCGLRWEECVQCVIRIVQSLAEQPVIRLFQQLVKVWQIRRTVAAALAASQKRVDSLDIGRGLGGLLADVINSAKFCYNRCRGFDSVGVSQISPFTI